MKPTPKSLWGIYLVDVFDNATWIAEIEGAALFEPQALASRPRPPVIPDKIKPTCRTAEVHVADIYSGPGLQGVPPGLPVSFYHNDPRAGGQLLGVEYTTSLLLPGQTEQMPFVWMNPPMNQTLTVYIVADDEGWNAVDNRPAGKHSECREENNFGFVTDIFCRPET